MSDDDDDEEEDDDDDEGAAAGKPAMTLAASWIAKLGQKFTTGLRPTALDSQEFPKFVAGFSSGFPLVLGRFCSSDFPSCLHPCFLWFSLGFPSFFSSGFPRVFPAFSVCPWVFPWLFPRFP